MSSELRSARQLQYLTGRGLAPILLVEQRVLISYTIMYIYIHIQLYMYALFSSP